MENCLLLKTKKAKEKLSKSEFVRRYGIACTALAALAVWTALVWITAERHGAIKTTELLTAEFEQEYTLMTESFKAEWITEHTPTADEQAEAQIKAEADSIARAIGTMKSKRQKLSMLWNILMRVDSPYYPNTVEEVVNQPQQWMFYDSKNPVRDDDVELALEQLKLWHDGRYPAGLSSTLVYGEWSEHDYVLRDTWDKTYKTVYWRFPE